MQDLDKQASLVANRLEPESALGSLYGDMVAAMPTHTGNVTGRCGECRGRGYKRLSAKALAEWERRIGEAKDPRQRDNLRRRLRAASSCPRCRGSGATASHNSRHFCDACEGTCYAETGETCAACRGAGRVNLGDSFDFFTTAKCPRCRGTAEEFNEDLQDVCPLCRGAAYTVPVTARETGSSRKGRVPPGTERADDHTTSGAAGKALVPGTDEVDAIVQRLDPTSAEVLRVFRGATGDRWARTRRGRFFALYGRTEDGRGIFEAFAASSPKRAAFLRDALEVLNEIHEAEFAQPPQRANHVLRARFAQADRDAREMARVAQQALQHAGGAV